jgi:hypothetical protein
MVAIQGKVCVKKYFWILILSLTLMLIGAPASGMQETFDRNIENAVIVSSMDPDDSQIRDFERWGPSWTNPRNYYDWYRARKDFNGERLLFWASGLSLLEQRGKIVNDPVQGKVLRVKYPSGKYGSKDSGVAFPWILSGKYEELVLSYRVKFQEHFQFTTSGKLPGLCGATDEIGCFRYTGGNPPNGDDGFSVRVVWLNGEGSVGTYVYHANQIGTYGDIFQWKRSNGDPIRFIPGQWYTIELRVVLNDPGVANGYAKAWLDGEFVSHADGLLFRNDSAAGRSIRVNEMYFNTFHGGNKSSDSPSQTQYAYFDDFKLYIYRILPVEPSSLVKKPLEVD